MKKITIILLISSFITQVYAQEVIVADKDAKAILQGRTEPMIEKKLNPLLVLNNIVIRDTLKIANFRKNYLSSVKNVKYLNEEQAFGKYGISHKDGILIVYTKKKIIDL